MKNKKCCDVCGKELMVDDLGNGRCRECGWYQNVNSITYPNSINSPNFVSLNQAKELYKKGKKFLPTYQIFLSLIDRGFDISFTYNQKRYLVDKYNNVLTLWEMGTNNYQEYNNINEFNINAKIDNLFLKNIWDKIKNIRYED